MEKIKIILENGVEKEVSCIFYLYNSNYYFIYTEEELDENGYVVLPVVKVGKEIINNIDTGYMIGIEIQSTEEWKTVQESISKIVNDKKNNTTSPEVQYLPLNMISKLKILSKKIFRLRKDTFENVFRQNVDNKLETTTSVVLPQENLQNVSVLNTTSPAQPTLNLENNVEQTIEPIAPAIEQPIENSVSTVNKISDDVIVDYRTAFFEQQVKNQELEAEIESLKNKIENIKNVVNIIE